MSSEEIVPAPAGRDTFSSGRTFRRSACDGQETSQCPHWMHIPALVSWTRGRVFSSAGSTIDVGQTTEQIPHRVQRFWSTSIVVIMVFLNVVFLTMVSVFLMF